MAAETPAEIVLGAAVGLTRQQVTPFLTSLRNAGYSGRVVLLADAALRRSMRTDPIVADLTLLPAHRWLPFRLGLFSRPRLMRWAWRPIQSVGRMLLSVVEAIPSKALKRLDLQRHLTDFVFTPMEARFLRYHAFLKAHPHQRVLLSDVRDVVFQTDPFQHLPRTGLATGLENPAYTIARWIELVYGPKLLARLGHHRVSCVGVTYGDGPSIRVYLEAMAEEIMRLTPVAIGAGGADTAIHNFLLRTRRLGDVNELETLAGPLATLNGFEEEEIPVTTEGRVRNRDGSEISVIHQYDRVPGLASKLLYSVTTRGA
jgi:hypothetical protein